VFRILILDTLPGTSFQKKKKKQGEETKHHSAFLDELPQRPRGSFQIHGPVGQSVRKIKMCNLRLLEQKLRGLSVFSDGQGRKDSSSIALLCRA